jgi:hypothetical protein
MTYLSLCVFLGVEKEIFNKRLLLLINIDFVRIKSRGCNIAPSSLGKITD